MYKNILLVIAVTFSLSMFACKSESSKFQGKSEDVTNGGGGGDGDAECVPGQLYTTATLLTSVLDQSENDRTIEYEISVRTCDDEKASFEANEILFDYDAFVASGDVDNPMPFKLVTESGESFSGEMITVKGSDLFGRTLESFSHHKTDKKVNITSTSQKATLTLDASNVKLKCPVNETTLENRKCDKTYTEMTIATHLRFGEATPVTVDITVKN